MNFTALDCLLADLKALETMTMERKTHLLFSIDL